METVLEIFKELLYIGAGIMLVIVVGFGSFCFKHNKHSDELHNKRS